MGIEGTGGTPVEEEIGRDGSFDTGLEAGGEAIGEDVNVGGPALSEIGAERLEHHREGEGVVGVSGAGDGERRRRQTIDDYTGSGRGGAGRNGQQQTTNRASCDRNRGTTAPWQLWKTFCELVTTELRWPSCR